MNYVTIVNEALRESGITLDSLNTGGSDFVSPPDPMYTKFKQWAAQAWEDIQLLKRDWEYMQNSGVLIVYPRIDIYAAYESTGTAGNFVGAEVQMHAWGGSKTITTSTFTLDSGALASGTAEGNVIISSFTDTAATFEPGDNFVNSTGSLTFRFKRWAPQSFSQAASQQLRDGITDVAEIKRESFRIADGPVTYSTSNQSTSWDRLYYVSYADWLRYGYDRPTNIGKPRYFTEDYAGGVLLWPPPDGTYHMYFEYTKTPQTLSAYNDEPTGLPSRYHKAIVWLTVMYWAEYDGHAQQYARAKSRYERILSDMSRDLLPPIKVTYDARNW